MHARDILRFQSTQLSHPSWELHLPPTKLAYDATTTKIACNLSLGTLPKLLCLLLGALLSSYILTSLSQSLFDLFGNTHVPQAFWPASRCARYHPRLSQITRFFLHPYLTCLLLMSKFKFSLPVDLKHITLKLSGAKSKSKFVIVAVGLDLEVNSHKWVSSWDPSTNSLVILFGSEPIVAGSPCLLIRFLFSFIRFLFHFVI